MTNTGACALEGFAKKKGAKPKNIDTWEREPNQASLRPRPYRVEKEGAHAWREEAGGQFRETAKKAPEQLVTQHNAPLPTIFGYPTRERSHCVALQAARGLFWLSPGMPPACRFP